jgi:hypothetical protein
MDDDGGGWTMVMKIDGDSPTMSYGANFWTQNNVLNDGSLNDNYDNAKFAAFNFVPFTDIRIKMRVDATDYSGGSVTERALIVNASGSSMLAVTSSGTYKAFDNDRTKNDWFWLAGPKSGLQQYCNQQGFNIGPYTRIGFIANENSPNDCSSPDALIGIGNLFDSAGGNWRYTAGNPVTWTHAILPSPECGCGSYSFRSDRRGLEGDTILYVGDRFDCASRNYCRGRGYCSTQNLCVCQTGWGGPECGNATCNNIVSTNPSG